MPHKKAFLAGILIAAAISMAIFEPFAVFAARKGTLNELSLMKRFNLFGSKKRNRSFLNKNITQKELHNAFGAVLCGLGFIGEPTDEALIKAEIIEKSNGSSYVSREEGAICILRSIMLAWVKRAIPRPEEVTYTPLFKDWQIDSKYLSTLIFAKNTGLINGVSKDKFKPTAKLKRREAVCLLTRFYNFVLQFKHKTESTVFLDVPKDHFMLDPIASLDKAGAFAYTDLGKKLSPTKYISVNDMVLIAQGIINKQSLAGSRGAFSKLENLKRSFGKKAVCRRSALSVIAATTAAAIRLGTGTEEADAASVLSFKASDYAKLKPELVKAAVEYLNKMGIKLGYTSRLEGRERTTRYEALGVMLKVITTPRRSEPKTECRAATRADAQAFAKKLRERKAEISRILNRK